MIWQAVLSFLTSRAGLILCAGLALSAGAFYIGARWQYDQCQAGLSAQREALVQQLQAEQARANEASAQYETEKASRTQAAQIITKEVTRVIQKPVYQSCRIDADGLRLLESAVHQANRASQSHSNVPNTVTTQ